MYKFKTKLISLTMALLLLCQAGVFAIAEEADTTPAAPAVIGDVTGDGTVSMLDVTEMQKYIAKLVEFTPEQIICADVNGDGTVDMLDVTTVQQYLAELIKVLPAEKAADDSDSTDTSSDSDATDTMSETENDTAIDTESEQGTETETESEIDSGTDSSTDSVTEESIIDFCGTTLMLSKLKEYETSATYAWASKKDSGESICIGITIEDILSNFVTLPENAESLTFTADDNFSKTFNLNSDASGVYYANDDGLKMMLAWSVDNEDMSKLRLIVPYDGENPNKGLWVGSVVTVVANLPENTETDTSTTTETETDTSTNTEEAIIDFCGTPLMLSKLKEYETSATCAWVSKKDSGESVCIGITIEDILTNLVSLPKSAESLTFTADDNYSKTFMLDTKAPGVYYANDDGVKMMLAWSVDGEDMAKLRLIVPYDGENPNKGSWVGSVVKVTVNLPQN